jgi:putative component of toxin-antitoxin plasmid stabilization module
LADADRLFTAQQRIAIVDRVAADPHCGSVIPGGGGIRKLRVAGRGKGNLIYLFGGADVPVFLLAVFAKNEKADLTAAQRVTLGKQVTGMLAAYRRQR